MSRSGLTRSDLSPEQKRALLAKLLHEKAGAARTLQAASKGQQALWFLHQAAPESPAYHTAFATRILSELDPAVLRSVFHELVDRHPALRTTFTVHDGEPMQEVHAFPSVSFEHVDAASWSAEELESSVAKSYRFPFDLAHGPLFRVVLFTRDTRSYVLLLTFHHSICDAWSIWLLLNEFGQLYPAMAARQSARLPIPAATFANFVDWQRHMLAGPDGERLLVFWERQLSGELPTLDLPGFPSESSADDSPEAATVFFPLESRLLSRLKTLASTQGTTLYSVLLAAFQVLLHRYTGQDDIIVGSPMAGRTQPAFEGVVGYFVNPLPLRANLTGEPRFGVFLQQVRRTVLDALAHQDYPFPLLVERLQPRRTGSRSPIFQVLFVFQKPQESSGLTGRLKLDRSPQRMIWGGLEVEPFPLTQMEGQFDLTLEISEGGACALKYRLALLDESAIRRMASHFQVLLESIVHNPDCRVSQLPILSQAERRQIVTGWNDTEVDYPKKQCVHRMIEEQVARTPEAPCVEFEGQRWNYRELNERANGIAHWLRARGVGPEMLVGICVERSREMVAGLLGVLKSGAAYVPLDPSYPRERLQFMLSDSGVRVVLTQRKFAGELAGRHVELLFIDGPLRASELGNPESGVTAEQISYMIYTSGSTGQPKGALNTHRGLCNRLLWMQDRYRLTAADAVLQKTPFSFDVSVWEFYWPLMTGARLVLARPGGHQDRDYLIELIAARGVTVLHFVPSMLQTFLEGPGVENCGSVRHVFCSGNALSREVEDRFFAVSGAELHNLYGPTEAAIDVTFWDCKRGGRRSTVPIGRPIACTQIYILDQQHEPVPIGVVGELFIGGEGLARGYWKRPELTAAAFIPNPFGPPGTRLYRTGDRARFLADGDIEYRGRLDYQVKLRGFRVELGEVEAALARHPAVREAVVVARMHLQEQQLVAYLVLRGSEAPLNGELRRFLAKGLPDHMIPSAFVFLEAMPLSANGKIDRRALPAPTEGERPRLNDPLLPPQNETEHTIAGIWRQVLRIETIGIHDNFFELGGHSLLLAQVHAQLTQTFGNGMSLAEMLEFPTVHALAQRVHGKITPARPRASVPSGARSSLIEQRLLRTKSREAT